MSRTTKLATTLRNIIAETQEPQLHEYDNRSLRHLATTEPNRPIAIAAMGELQYRSETKNARLVYASS